MALLSDLRGTISVEVQNQIAVVATLWSTLQSVALGGIGTVAELGGEMAAALGTWLPGTDDELGNLRNLGGIWAGYGVNVQASSPSLALFFRGPVDDVAKLLPDAIRNLNPELVPHVNLKAIPPGKTRSAAKAGPAAASPGASIDWVGTGCRRGSASTGTLGAFLTDGTDTWILSANHVMSQNGSCTSNQIVVPGLGTVSTVVKPVIISGGGVNPGDIAIALWNGENAFSPQIPGLPPLATGAVAPQAAQNRTVMKVGEATGKQSGIVRYVAETILATPFPPFTDATFGDQILVEGSQFADEGDSGSLVVLSDGASSAPVGMLVFKGVPAKEDPQPIYNAVTPIENVLTALEGLTGKTLTLMTSAPVTQNATPKKSNWLTAVLSGLPVFRSRPTAGAGNASRRLPGT